MDDWEKFNKATLPEKEGFYRNLDMENILMQIACMQKEFLRALK